MSYLADLYPGFASRWIDSDSGHYLAEEAPEATAHALIEFFTG